MYLKSLEMAGFKSFAEAKIEFPEGITAIVGPNGSGKSNVVDAILWVLGEQSTKTLRSERMEDVIFNGTAVRKPLGMSEVSLIIGGFDNQKLDGVSGLSAQLSEFQELMITRRLYRNGDSDYLINKTPCRLKDIRSLLLDTRAGSKGQTVIAQGQIDQILNASPQDRRELIEETAGIVRYKRQKAEALRKLDATQQNLLRVRDIIAEVKKQLNSLERQARQARSYQTLQQEAKGVEIRLLTREYRALRLTLETIEAEIQELDVKETGQVADQARLGAEIETAKLSIAAAADSMHGLREELSRVEQAQAQALTASEVERNRSELFDQQRGQAAHDLSRIDTERQDVAGEIASLQATLDQLEQETSERERTFASLDQHMRELASQRAAAGAEEERGRFDIVNLTVLVANTEQSLLQSAARGQEIAARSSRLAGEQEELESQRLSLRAQRDRAVIERQETDQQLVGLTQQRVQILTEAEQLGMQSADTEQSVIGQAEELAAVDSRLRALQSVLLEEMGYGRRGEDGTALKACEGVREALAEWLVVPPGLDRAVEAILGERLRGWLVDHPSAACRAIEFLKQKELGRGTFMPQVPRWTAGDANRVPAWWPALAERPGVIGRAIDLVQAPSQAEATLRYLFDGIVIVETLEAAISLWERHDWSAPTGPVLVTVAGEILDAAGTISGGGSAATGGLLQRRREVLELEGQRTQLVGAVESARQRREQLVARIATLRDDERQAGEQLREVEMSALSLRKDEAGLDQQLSELDRRLDLVVVEIRNGRDEQARVEQEVRSGQAQLEQWAREKGGQEAALGRVKARLTALEQELGAHQQRVTDARLQAENVRSRREHGMADLERLHLQQRESEERARALEEHIAGLATAIERSHGERQRQEALCQDLGRTSGRLKADLVAAQERQAQAMAAADQVEVVLAGVRQALSTLRELRMGAEVRKAEVKTQLINVEGTLSGTYQLTPATLLESPTREHEGAVGASSEASAIDADEEELRDQLKKIRERLDRMGPINLAAIEEHRELEERYRFLSTQEQDLSNSISSLKEIIQRINRTTKDMFLSTFSELQQKFGDVFMQFFPGGRAELVLVDEPAGEGTESHGKQEPGVDIVAQPPGKRLKSIAMLSGGEKTLTAMALLFASFLIRPTPFCILDEIDAPLDEENIGRFTAVLKDLARSAQFMVITHNKRTMGMADSLFGVTMEEPGISKLVSVRLADLQPA